MHLHKYRYHDTYWLNPEWCYTMFKCSKCPKIKISEPQTPVRIRI